MDCCLDCFGRTTRETFNVLRDSAPSVLGAPIYGTRSEWPWEDDELIVKRPDLPRTKSELCFARMTCMLPCRASIVLSSEQLFAVFPFFLYIQIHKCDIYIYIVLKSRLGCLGLAHKRGMSGGRRNINRISRGFRQFGGHRKLLRGRERSRVSSKRLDSKAA